MRITLFGALVFIALLIGYFYWAGNVPSMAEESLGTRRGYDRAWFYCSALFAVGAGNACFGDKQYGMFPPTSLRWLFVLLGVLLMTASVMWMHSLREMWSRPDAE